MDTVAELSAQEHAPLVIAPAGRVGRLLLATDQSSVSEGATDRAIQLAVAQHADVVVLTVIDPGRLRLPGGRFLRRIDQERARLEAGAQEIVARARAAGVRATFLIWEGDPAESIIEASEAEGADLIVIGSHGRGVIGRLVLGSISARVADGARCRVMIVGAPSS